MSDDSGMTPRDSGSVSRNGFVAYEIGGWSVEPRRNLVRSPDGAEHRLEPRVMEVLVYLASTPGGVCTREEILGDVWRGQHVGDDALTRTISALRRVFADDARRPRVIETIPKSGYRLVPAVVRRAAMPQAVATARLPRFGSPTRVAAALAVAGAAVVALVVTAPRTGGEMQGGGPVPGADAPVVQLTSLDGREIQPTLSPDGQRVVYAGDGEGGHYDLFVAAANRAGVQRLTATAAHELSPVWSPDGKRIAFARTDREACAILAMAAPGDQVAEDVEGALVRLAGCAPNAYPDLAWSSDGRWLAYTDRARVGGAYAVRAVEIASGANVAVTRPPAGIRGDQLPMFVDLRGGELAVIFVRSLAYGISDLYRVDLRGSDPVRLTHDALKIPGVAWDAAGGRLLFTSNRQGTFSLWEMGPDGGALRRLPMHGEAFRISLASRHDAIAFDRWEADVDIWSVPDPFADRVAGPSRPTPLLTSSRWDSRAVGSPDGSRIAFVSDRSGAAEIWIAEHDGTAARQVTDFGGPFTASPSWSPDGSTVAFESRAGGRADIYVVPSTGGEPRALASSGGVAVAPSWSRDGRWIYFASTRGGDWQVWRTDPTGTRQGQVTRNGGFVAFETADGAALLYTRRGETRIWRRDLATGAETPVLDTGVPGESLVWTLGAGAAWYVAGSDLVRFDLESRSSRSAALEAPVEHIAVFPQGGDLLYGVVERHDSDILLVRAADPPVVAEFAR